MHFALKPLALFALTFATVQAEYGPDAIIPFAEEPRLKDPDDTPMYVAQPGVSDDVNATDSYDFTSLERGDVSEHTDAAPATESEVAVDNVANAESRAIGAAVIVGFQVAAVAAPIVADIIKGQRKDCHQLACWIGTSSRTCGLSVAERVQAEVTMGRDRFRYESIDDNGIWVRFWRTKFEPVDRGDIVTGECTNGVPYTVTNCMSTGNVKC